MKRRLAVVTSVAAIAVAVSATPAAAGHECGPMNMKHGGSHGGMQNAMSHVAPQGAAGMFGAFANAPC